MHTHSVLCRLFADLVHTLRRVNVFHSNAAPRPAGAHAPFFEGKGADSAEVAVLWPPTPNPTPLGEGAAALLGEATAAAAATFEDEEQRSVRRRPSGTAATGCGKPEQGEDGHNIRQCSVRCR